MTLTFEVDPPVDQALTDSILDLWVDVTNAGGAVGFVAPVTGDDVRPALRQHLVGMAQGTHRLLVGRDEDGTVAATAVFAFNTHRLMTHWVWLYTVMVHPKHQGKGYGRDLMAAVERAVRTAPGFEGVDAIRLGVRGGTGTDTFYAKAGYQEVGRVPGAIRVADDDYRDDITMLLTLT
ncbi:GNAT family N-acetyltransferase [Streptomyces sp. NPDC057854]|uniref:GNAT family N-acetyltransferase n=1 Tax=unclassified Streptomyces TaxID=2593676 RepID=UPI0036B6FEC3